MLDQRQGRPIDILASDRETTRGSMQLGIGRLVGIGAIEVGCDPEVRHPTQVDAAGRGAPFQRFEYRVVLLLSGASTLRVHP
jgi:hypothetical protein